jgi:hypothetical protein
MVRLRHTRNTITGDEDVAEFDGRSGLEGVGRNCNRESRQGEGDVVLGREMNPTEARRDCYMQTKDGGDESDARRGG